MKQVFKYQGIRGLIGQQASHYADNNVVSVENIIRQFIENQVLSICAMKSLAEEMNVAMLDRIKKLRGIAKQSSQIKKWSLYCFVSIFLACK